MSWAPDGMSRGRDGQSSYLGADPQFAARSSIRARTRFCSGRTQVSTHPTSGLGTNSSRSLESFRPLVGKPEERAGPTLSLSQFQCPTTPGQGRYGKRLLSQDLPMLWPLEGEGRELGLGWVPCYEPWFKVVRSESFNFVVLLVNQWPDDSSIDEPSPEVPAIVHVTYVEQLTIGYPNDEAWECDPRFQEGSGFYEIVGSPWPRLLKEYNTATYWSQQPPGLISGSRELSRRCSPLLHQRARRITATSCSRSHSRGLPRPDA